MTSMLPCVYSAPVDAEAPRPLEPEGAAHPVAHVKVLGAADHADDEQPSYVFAIPCRPILVGLSSLGVLPSLANVNWASVMTYAATDGMHLNRIVEWPAVQLPPGENHLSSSTERL